MSYNYDWLQSQTQESRSYICGYCGHSLASEKGYKAVHEINRHSIIGHIYICHHCNQPTFFDISSNQTPGVIFGRKINYITDKNVEELYQEARRCIGAESFTAAAMCCRKLLMNIAVSKGAKKNLSFAEYVGYLCDNHYVPIGAKGWVDHIRDKGNEANHEIEITSKEDAIKLMKFTESLLVNIFELPGEIPAAS